MTDKAATAGLTVDTHNNNLNNSPKVEHSASLSPTKLKLQGQDGPQSPNMMETDELEEWANNLFKDVHKYKGKIDGTIDNLDEKLNVLLAK